MPSEFDEMYSLSVIRFWMFISNGNSSRFERLVNKRWRKEIESVFEDQNG